MVSTDTVHRSHRGAGFLFLLAFALLATGLAFAFAPQYSWQVTKIARQASALGLANGALVVGGLVTLGLGIVARAAGSSSAPPPDSGAEREALQSELQILNEQFSTKLAQIRTALMQLGDTVASIAAQQQTLAQPQGESASAVGDSGDAIFRLAASLDKLHAHLDERVHAVDLQIRSGFESLLGASQDVRRLLAQGGFAAPAAETRAFGPTGSPAPSGAGEGLAFYETMKKLDAIAGEASGSEHTAGAHPHAGPHPQAPFPSSPELDVMLPEEYRNRY